jgi:hypothetical protein
MKYLDVLMPCNLEEAYKINYFPLIDKIEFNVQRWRSLSISMLHVGRVNTIKMYILPRLMYLFHALTVSISSNLLNK